MKGKHKIKKSLIVIDHDIDKKRLGEILSKELPNCQINFLIDNDCGESVFEEKGNSKLDIEISLLNDAEKYQFLFKNTTNAIFLIDLDKEKYIDANKSALNLTGRTIQELRSLTFSEIHGNGTENVFKKLKGNSKISNETIEYKRPDGSVKVGMLNVLHFKGNLYYAISQDITNLLSTQTDSIEQNRAYKNLLNNLPGFVYQCKNDESRTMIYISSACERITGYKPVELIENKTFSYNDLIIEKEQQKLVWEKMQVALKEKKRFNHKYPIQAKSKKIKWLQEKAVGVFSDSGELLYIEGFVTEISEAVRYEKVQKAILNISSSLMRSFDLEAFISTIKFELGKIIDTTNFYIALYDQSKDTFSLPFFSDQKDDVTDIPAGKTMTKYVVDNQKSLLANIDKKQEMVEKGLLEYKGSLSKIWLGVPLKVEGKIIGVLAVQSYEDENAFNESDMQLLEFVSDQLGLSIQIKRKEEELKQALLKAEEADRLKTSFLANMSHEIRTPMNGILGFTQLLREDDLTMDERLNFLSIIEKSGNRMLNIINDLIDVSKVDAGLMDVNITGVDLYEVCNYLYEFFLREVEEKGMKLKLEHPDQNKSILIQTDGEKLYAILTNLIKNAIKYSEIGTITFGYDDNGKEIDFFVKDTGIGIPEEKKKDVFNRFVQLNAIRDKFTEGSGLGLSITKAYVELLGGKISFKSEEKKGSEFYFQIPYSF